MLFIELHFFQGDKLEGDHTVKMRTGVQERKRRVLRSDGFLSNL